MKTLSNINLGLALALSVMFLVEATCRSHEPAKSIKVPKALLTCLSLRYDREPLRVLPDVRQVALELMGTERAVLSCGGESWLLEIVP